MKLKFLFAFVLAFFFATLQPINAQVQDPTPQASTDPIDFSTFNTGVDCYASGEFMIHAYENRLDCYSQDGLLRSFKVKSCSFKEDTLKGVITKIYNTTSGSKFQIKINGDEFDLKTPFDDNFQEAFQYEFTGIYRYSFDGSKVGFVWPYTSFSKSQIETPWGIQKIPPLQLVE